MAFDLPFSMVITSRFIEFAFNFSPLFGAGLLPFATVLTIPQGMRE